MSENQRSLKVGITGHQGNGVRRSAITGLRQRNRPCPASVTWSSLFRKLTELSIESTPCQFPNGITVDLGFGNRLKAFLLICDHFLWTSMHSYGAWTTKVSVIPRQSLRSTPPPTPPARPRTRLPKSRVAPLPRVTAQNGHGSQVHRVRFDEEEEEEEGGSHGGGGRRRRRQRCTLLRSFLLWCCCCCKSSASYAYRTPD